MVIYLFRDEANNENFALSIDETGENIPPITPHTEWIFVEVIDTLKFVEPWDIGDFSQALERLKANGYYMFTGEIIAPAATVAHPDELPECYQIERSPLATKKQSQKE
jgi:hypothetical protein